MDECCQTKTSELASLREKHGSLLTTVLAVNLAMFFVESIAAWFAHSTSLFADSLDMLGDAVVYGMSLSVIGKGPIWSARISLLKGMMMVLLGLSVVGQVVYRLFVPVLPEAESMGWIGALALAANITCAVLLLRHRNDDINMRSTWLCTRNDVFSNLGVLAAAGLVAVTHSQYPDRIVGSIVAILVLHSAYSVIRDSMKHLKSST